MIILIGMALAGFRGFNYGIDFTGGTLIEINTNKYIPTEELRQITDSFDPGMQINYIGEERDGVQLKTTADLNNEKRTELFGKPGRQLCTESVWCFAKCGCGAARVGTGF